jgi:hypothetical protein
MHSYYRPNGSSDSDALLPHCINSRREAAEAISSLLTLTLCSPIVSHEPIEVFSNYLTIQTIPAIARLMCAQSGGELVLIQAIRMD